jgi:predicted nucleic acid-binding protein
MLTVDASVWVAAYDPRDRFHESSVAFLLVAARKQLPLNGPAFVVVESACAVARVTRSAASGRAAQKQMRAHPLLDLVPVGGELLEAAARLGTEKMLRGADALYAATAHATRGELISWDDELVRCAGAATPESWIKNQ